MEFICIYPDMRVSFITAVGKRKKEFSMHGLINLNQFKINKLSVKNSILTYRAYEHIPYVSKPVAPEYQQLSIYVPGCYYEGGVINGYSLHTAPVFMPNTVGGYMPGPVDAPNVNDEGEPNTIARALQNGYVVVSAGARGRGVKDADGKNIGVAPAAICDLKAAVRFLRHHAGELPGDMEKIITNGTSAGGAMSALQGATGNHPDYESYLEKMGACKERDDVFASSCYCPITNLDHADMAYEWEFYGLNDYHGYNGSGDMSKEQIALSKELKKMFSSYVNGLNLKNESGRALTLDENGNGTFKEYVLQTVLRSAQKQLDEMMAQKEQNKEDRGNSLESDRKVTDWLTIENGKAITADFDKFIKYRTRMKATPAFDSVGLGSWENEVFGMDETEARHFSKFSYEHSTVNGTLADKQQIKMMNPMYYIDDAQAVKAKHFRIRHGSVDRDTSLAISNMLALKLRNAGMDAEVMHPWGIPHAGDYDLDELFAWIDEICSVG